jgi:hypothetical protein
MALSLRRAEIIDSLKGIIARGSAGFVLKAQVEVEVFGQRIACFGFCQPALPTLALGSRKILQSTRQGKIQIEITYLCHMVACCGQFSRFSKKWFYPNPNPSWVHRIQSIYNHHVTSSDACVFDSNTYKSMDSLGRAYSTQWQSIDMVSQYKVHRT